MMVALAIIAIVYGALVAMMQPDMKLVAYSSVSHGICHAGHVCSESEWTQRQHSAADQSRNFDRRCSDCRYHMNAGIRVIAQFGGLSTVMPVYATIFLIMTMSSIGLPLLNGFIGEFTIMMGALQVNLWWAVFGGAGIVLGAAYMLWLYQRTMFGKHENPLNQNLLDLNARELATWFLCHRRILDSLYPAPFFKVLDKPVNKLVETIHPGYFKANAPQAARVVGETLMGQFFNLQDLGALLRAGTHAFGMILLVPICSLRQVAGFHLARGIAWSGYSWLIARHSHVGVFRAACHRRVFLVLQAVIPAGSRIAIIISRYLDIEENITANTTRHPVRHDGHDVHGWSHGLDHVHQPERWRLRPIFSSVFCAEISDPMKRL
jgi:NADH:ubiquinone oxidoreductase subunit 5 (subunit L)/multisubunit Na+/H+ antiporter MnhA subunit